MSRIDTRMTHLNAAQPQAPPAGSGEAATARQAKGPPTAETRQSDRVELSPLAGQFKQVASANLEAAASAPQDPISLVQAVARLKPADTFGADKAVDAFPNMGVAAEGKIDRPLLQPVEPSHQAPDQAASRTEIRTVKGPSVSARPEGVDTPTRPDPRAEAPGPEVRPEDVGQASPGQRQDAEVTPTGGSPVDFGTSPGSSVNVQA